MKIEKLYVYCQAPDNCNRKERAIIQRRLAEELNLAEKIIDNFSMITNKEAREYLIKKYKNYDRVPTTI